MEKSAPPPASPPPPPSPEMVQENLHRLRAQQSISKAIMAGAAAAGLGAALWAALTVLTGYQIGWMAIGVGALVGYSVRRFGKGIDPIFGYAGAGLSLFGCLLGNVFAFSGLIAQQEGMAFFHVLRQIDPKLALDLLIETGSPMDLLFYGFAVYEGYRFSFRPLAPAELGAA